MTHPYRLLILGYDSGNLNKVTVAFQLLTVMIRESFCKLDHVVVSSISVPFPLRGIGSDVPAITHNTNLPRADFVLIISFPNKINTEQVNIIREKTQAIKIASLCENSFAKLGVDHSFVFNSYFLHEGNVSFINIPCSKKLLKTSPKTKLTILIDHYWDRYLGTEYDYTFKIENWLESVASKYKIYRLIKFPNEEKHIKSFEVPIINSNYLLYLQNTKNIENFIVTHKETFAYSVIDMAARDTRVISPSNFLCPCMIENLKIPTFNNHKEFIDILQTPVGTEWDLKINNCTDYEDVALAIDCKFQEWINT